MESLSNDALHGVLRHLSPADLLAAGQTCGVLRGAAKSKELWRQHCTRRWHEPNVHLYPADPDGSRSNSGSPTVAGSAAAGAASPGAGAPQPQADWRLLYVEGNGWSPGPGHWPDLHVARWAGCSWADELVALQSAAAAVAGSSTTIAISSCRELRLLELGAHPQAQLQTLRAGVHAQGPGSELWSAVAALPGGRVAAGGCYGRLALFHLPQWRSASPGQALIEPEAALAFPDNSIVSQLHYLPQQQLLAALHDPLALLRPLPQRGGLRLIDAHEWRDVSPGQGMRDVMDGYELAAAAPVGATGAEFVCGSVKLSDDQSSGWACQRCCAAAPGALCFHKAPAAAAGLCFFDCRATQAMVARFSTAHRSLYPHIEAVRQHFLLTSHAGTPVAVWDCRHMNGPVHEVQPLPLELDPRVAAALPLGAPDEYGGPSSEALHLSASPDVLLGRADSGMVWLFDLSERMGWADGSRCGSWLQAMQAASPASSSGMPAAAAAAAGGAGGGGAAASDDWEASEGGTTSDVTEEGHLDECDFEQGPRALGCIEPPYEVWCSSADEAAPLHWLPPAAVWAASGSLVALGGLELEDKQVLFPPYAQGSPYPSNALVAASLVRRRELR